MKTVDAQDFARLISFSVRRKILDDAAKDLARQEKLAEEEWAQISAGLLLRYGTTEIDLATGLYVDEP